MNGITIIITLVFGILSVILFFKVWGMCNRVSEIKDILERPQKTTRYDYYENNSIETLQAECRYVKELAACGKMDEAQYNLKRLQYNLEEDDKRLQKRVSDVGYYMRDKREAVNELEKFIEELS